ncbi:Subtilisin-like protease SBT5.4 [Linum perenne]
MGRQQQFVFLSLVSCLLLCLFSSTAATKKHYIVYLGGHGSEHASSATEADLHAVTDSHHQLLATYLGVESAREAIRYSYTRHINGFTALLHHHQAAQIAKHPGVVSVFLDRPKKPLTTHSWNFMSLERGVEQGEKLLTRPSGLWKAELTTVCFPGVWPESQSFTDQGYGPVPSRWKGSCSDKTKDGVLCNKKLIGARYFNKGILEVGGAAAAVDFPSDLYSTRDFSGHGTYTLSIAAGNFVPGANFSGAAPGVAKGGSPRARVASYKTCYCVPSNCSCYDSDILSAFEAAISDGVDVLSVSLGGQGKIELFEDALAIGAFHAVMAGIPFVAAAGNDGPGLGTVVNVAPWILTVAASTIDRAFDTFAELGNGLRIRGSSMTESLPEHKFYPLMSAADARLPNSTVHDALLCIPGALDPGKVKGKILTCLRGEIDRIEKSRQASKAGAVGMILCNDKSTGDKINSDAHFIPSAHIGYKDGLVVFRYIRSMEKPTAFIKPTLTRFGEKPAPTLSDFSSRGPNTLTPQILKPDVAAPGVQILGAFTMKVSNSSMLDEQDHRMFPYQFQTGTSTATPHVAGLIGLIRAIHPDWSPSAIQSAIMTTARTKDNTGSRMTDMAGGKANPFGYGSGHIRPNRAADPGLVYEVANHEYLDFLCSLGYNSSSIDKFLKGHKNCRESSQSVSDFNYPSISVPNLQTGSVTVTRRVKNVGSPTATYVAKVKEPSGVSVEVEPKVLEFITLGEEKIFKVTLTSKRKGSIKGFEFGRLTWTDGVHYVRSPIMVSEDLKIVH